MKTGTIKSRRSMHGLLLLPLCLSMLHCGHVVTTHRILTAQAEIDAAFAVDAQAEAPYEFTKAQEYLHKAKEEEGYAAYQVSMKFGADAMEYGKQARLRAQGVKVVRPSDTTPVLVEPKTRVEPRD